MPNGLTNESMLERIYTELVGLSNLYGAAYILRAVGIDSAGGEEEERSEVWLRDFQQRLTMVATANLAALGATAHPGVTNRRRRIRSLQLRRVDGYSGAHEELTTLPTYTSE